MGCPVRHETFEGCIGQNVVNITIKVKTIVRIFYVVKKRVQQALLKLLIWYNEKLHRRMVNVLHILKSLNVKINFQLLKKIKCLKIQSQSPPFFFIKHI